MLKKKLLLSRNLSQECHVNEKTMLQISNVFRVTSMSIERFVKKYKYIFQYKVDAWSYYFSLYNTYLVNITVNLQFWISGDRQLVNIVQSAGADTQPVFS